MIKILSRIEKLVLEAKGLRILDITEDPECEAYAGCSFQIGDRNVTFREAKRTPQKKGQFVTLWKRNHENRTAPFNITDDVDFYMIATRQQHRTGFFFFPKAMLGEQGVLTTDDREGKRGFRVYAGWDLYLNQQAERTKAWQANYFIDLTVIININYGKLNSIISRY